MLERTTNGTPLFGIVGWKKSGKTTLTVRLVETFVARGFRVATLKHAHHAFIVDDGETDSARHRRAGASQVAVTSGQRTAVITEHAPAIEADVAALAEKLDPADLILVEGFKRAPIAKIEARRRDAMQTDPLGDNARNIVAIAADHDFSDASVTVFDLSDVAAIADFITAHCGLRRTPS